MCRRGASHPPIIESGSCEPQKQPDSVVITGMIFFNVVGVEESFWQWAKKRSFEQTQENLRKILLKLKYGIVLLYIIKYSIVVSKKEWEGKKKLKTRSIQNRHIKKHRIAHTVQSQHQRSHKQTPN
jgi:hypothetical protein